MDAVLNLNPESLPDEAIASTLQSLVAHANRAQAAIVIFAAAMTERRAHEIAGHSTTAEFLTQRCHYAGREAVKLANYAQRLEHALPHTARALRTGQINWHHAATVVRAEEDLGAHRVRRHEQAWIANVAVHSGPERLQRVVRAHVEENGLTTKPPTTSEVQDEPHAAPPRPTPDSFQQLGVDPSAAAIAPAQVPTARTALWSDSPPEQCGELELTTSRRSTDQATLPRLVIGLGLTQVYSPQPGQPTRRCVHDLCALDADWREVHFTLRWQDDSETAFASVLPLCDHHFAELRARRHVAPAAAASRGARAKHAA
ncbi:hypothetical protein KALB_8435 [Kutzneria albida DSM 43870]|uniref:DUF222 domain-containing protein n=2 Tax=Kutzneria TaxID=43356 RepID=W5WMN3_9PSEU|nr:hypothetical protein KALB_8435 [Kutzneria albida DSM 43870]